VSISSNFLLIFAKLTECCCSETYLSNEPRICSFKSC